MTIKEITLKGEKTGSEARIKTTPSHSVEIYLRSTTTKGTDRGRDFLDFNAGRDEVYTMAVDIQLHLDGYKQTNSTINEYTELLIQLLGR